MKVTMTDLSAGKFIRDVTYAQCFKHSFNLEFLFTNKLIPTDYANCNYHRNCKQAHGN